MTAVGEKVHEEEGGIGSLDNNKASYSYIAVFVIESKTKKYWHVIGGIYSPTK